MPWRRVTLTMSNCGYNCSWTSKHSSSTRTGIRPMSADLSPPPAPPATASPATVVTVPGPTLPPALAVPTASILPATADLPLASPSRATRVRRVAARGWPVGLLGCGVVGAVLLFGRPSNRGADFLTAKAVRGDLAVSVTERGELDSVNSIMVRCEVEGEKSKLVSIAAEGTHVTKGEEVGRYDTEE